MKKANKSGFWERCGEMLGEDFEHFRTTQASPLKKTIRINTLKNSKEDFFAFATQNYPDWTLEPHRFHGDLFYITKNPEAPPLGKSIAYSQGRFYIQEASSCLPPLALDPQPGEVVLDMAAAPGSKTTQMAAMMKNSGLLVSNEFSGQRMKALAFNLRNSGVQNTILTAQNGIFFGKYYPESFDRILLDAPCTGEGTYRKDKKALEYWSLQNIEVMSKLQKKLIESAYEALKPGGRLVYSTCTLAPEENEAVVEHLLSYFPEANILPLDKLFSGAAKAPGLSTFEGRDYSHGPDCLRVWPQLFDSEGFFVAAIEKPLGERIYETMKPEKGRKNAFQELPKKRVEDLKTFFASTFGYEFPEHFLFLKREDEVWIAPEQTPHMIAQKHVHRHTLQLGQYTQKGFVITDECALVLGKDFTKNILPLSRKDTIAFLEGKDLQLPLKKGGWRDSPSSKEDLDKTVKESVPHYEGLPLGLVKRVGNIWKNKLPRNMVREGVY